MTVPGRGADADAHCLINGAAVGTATTHAHHSLMRSPLSEYIYTACKKIYIYTCGFRLSSMRHSSSYMPTRPQATPLVGTTGSCRLRQEKPNNSLRMLGAQGGACAAMHAAAWTTAAPCVGLRSRSTCWQQPRVRTSGVHACGPGRPGRTGLLGGHAACRWKPWHVLPKQRGRLCVQERHAQRVAGSWFECRPLPWLGGLSQTTVQCRACGCMQGAAWSVRMTKLWVASFHHGMDGSHARRGLGAGITATC